MKDTPLGWDPEKKKERDHQRDIQIERSRVGDLYQDWQSALCKRARTRREIIQALYDLQKKLDETERRMGADMAKVVFPFETTKQMLSQKIAVLTAVQICAENTAIQHVPVTMEMATNRNVRRKTAKFKTVKEFQDIPWVKHFSAQPGFRGFYAKMSLEKMDIKYFIIAQYEKDAALVCELVNDVCLDDFAQYDDLDKPAEAGATNPTDVTARPADATGETGSPPADPGRTPNDGGSADSGQTGEAS